MTDGRRDGCMMNEWNRVLFHPPEEFCDIQFVRSVHFFLPIQPEFFLLCFLNNVAKNSEFCSAGTHSIRLCERGVRTRKIAVER